MTINAAKNYSHGCVFMELAKSDVWAETYNIDRAPMEPCRMKYGASLERWKLDSNQESIFGIHGGGPWPEQCNVPITIKDQVWYFHARPKHATQAIRLF